MYVIKIDLRKKNTFDNKIWESVYNKELWCNKDEDGYVKKSDAKIFTTKEDAENSVTEDWEMVCRF